MRAPIPNVDPVVAEGLADHGAVGAILRGGAGGVKASEVEVQLGKVEPGKG